ncbi:MAG: exodeoxyribonuclease V subunit gamma [Tessaracoccus sp.]|uniref:exodeoxyribonuclease V subunit gamma n=1 Tax=Tessaracoccus sp. TaxID=1971211 RepID=UPI001EB2B3D7|nr:exodeoxyribonuclease V subunit gamma [Tessaracoccus sp.]MBK7821357.1 exodeoxyribonuclease V subunit gamma [Tessaracoccus sp.]
MALDVILAHHWSTLLDELADRLRTLHTDPFTRGRVIVSSRATGRVVSQEVAQRLGISAGISYVTLRDLARELADGAGVGRDLSRWRGTPLDLATWEAVGALAEEFPALAHAANPERPGGRRAVSTRLARLQRWYLDHAPDLLQTWLDGADDGPGGVDLPEHLAWQPELVRATALALEVDPTETLAALADAARRDTTPTLVFAVDEVTAGDRTLLQALAEGVGLVALQPVGARHAGWVEPLGGSVHDALDLPSPPPTVAIHDSHGPARQVEVLRDELTRAFVADETLEPRDVLIVCPRPERYAHLLDAAFAPGGAHPGRTLRVQPVGGQDTNDVLDAVVALLRLGDGRATSSGLLELLLSPPLAHRWGFADRETVTELIAAAGIRWGLDAQHRASFDLGDVAQNTWMRGLDRLLVGLAVSPTTDSGLGLTGTDAVGSSDLSTVGALSEVLSRIRRLVATTAAPATVPEWAARTRGLLTDLVGVGWDDQWQLFGLTRLLAGLQRDHLGGETTLTRHEFAHLLADAGRRLGSRVAAGNGSLMVARLGELSHVGFRLVALLGVTDDAVPGRGGSVADAVDLGEAAPDERARRQAQLFAHASAAEKLLVVRQRFSSHTNDEVAPPAAIDWLVERLGVEADVRTHPSTATADANFIKPASFDTRALRGARARRGAGGTVGRIARRRDQARRRPVGAIPAQVTLTQLERFLADPAKAFLRSVAGIPLYQSAAVQDELPLDLVGLEKWKVVTALVGSLQSGATLQSVIDRFQSREELPPGLLGKVAFDEAKADAVRLWNEAGPRWQRPITDHAVDIEVDIPPLGRVRVVDSVRCRGGEALTVTASKGASRLVRPWLEALALTALGLPTTGRAVRFGRLPNTYEDQVLATGVGEPDREAARARLSAVMRAYALGQHRLLPVPLTPAIAYADAQAAGTFRQADWTGPTDWTTRVWPGMEDSWRLFFDDDLNELFVDAPLAEDPQGTSAFEAWALALYGNMQGVADE